MTALLFAALFSFYAFGAAQGLNRKQILKFSNDCVGPIASVLLAMGAGSLVLSHVNDGGFWFVKEYFNLTVAQTLKTWTVMETIISLLALVLIMLLNQLIK